MTLRPVMRARLLALAGAVLATMAVSGAPLASAAASTHPARPSAAPHAAPLTSPRYAPPGRTAATPLANRAASDTFQTLCLHNTSECLNDALCQLHTVQLWNGIAGSRCRIIASFAGTVNPAGWPFYCGHGFNVAYAGKPVFSIGIYDSDEGIEYAVQSAGFGKTVTLTPVRSVSPSLGQYLGLWVATDVSGTFVLNSPMIDAFETCNDANPPFLQYAYAGCGGDGCLVREEPITSSDATWDWQTITINTSKSATGTKKTALARLPR